ncbi:MAG: PfkB family carbohydrate kinase [Desulfomonilaceae bacterium]|jgi:sugar/nucleoside kinase (ribokinase family)
MYDVCVIGHVTKDLINIRGRTREMPGGTAYYAGMTLRSLGLNVAVITKVATGDERALLEPLVKSGVRLFVGHSKFTSAFENIYVSPDRNERIQKVKAVGDSFLPEDLGRIQASAFHLGPLTPAEMTPDFIEQLSRLGGLVSLDAQGFTRGIERQTIVPQDWCLKEQGLAHVDILKVDDSEAAMMSGGQDIKLAAQRLADFGPAEVIITMGSSGSLIFAHRTFYRIAAVPTATISDPTGCGDTYVAGYLAHRLKSNDLDKAGRFAARLASIKLQIFGALTRNRLPAQVLGNWQLPSRQ